MSNQQPTANPRKSGRSRRAGVASPSSAGSVGSVGSVESVESVVPPSGTGEPVTSADASSSADGVWAQRWDRWSQGQYLMTGIVLCALSLIGRAVPAFGALVTVRTVICLVIGITGAVIIIVPWVGKLRARSAASAAAAGTPGARPSVEQRLRQSPYPKALWVYAAWVALLATLAVLAFLGLAIGRHAPAFIIGVVLFGVPAVLFGSLTWTTRDIWSRTNRS